MWLFLMDRSRLTIIASLGTAQTLAWGSSYYLPAILADPIAHDLGISSNWFFAAFSASLVISGLLGPRVGRQIDRVGGRQVLCISEHRSRSGSSAARRIHVTVDDVDRLAAARRQHGSRSLRRGLRRVGPDLRQRCAERHHRHNADRRLRQYGRLAPQLGRARNDRLAGDLLRVGCSAHRHRAAVEPDAASRGTGRRYARPDGQAAHPDRPDHGVAVVRLRRGLDGDVGDGRASSRRSVRRRHRPSSPA